MNDGIIGFILGIFVGGPVGCLLLALVASHRDDD